MEDRDTIFRSPGLLESRGRRVAVPDDVREVPLPLDWPVYVSHAEASAYARWAGKALPTEAQWHRAAYGTPEGTERPYPWGSDAPDRRFGNFDFERWDPDAGRGFPGKARARSASPIWSGNGWEWTSTLFAPFPGFRAVRVLSRLFGQFLRR